MFHLDISDDEDTVPNSQHASKKRKFNIPFNPEVVHSSLVYSSFKAPPLVEYSSIDSYCEKKVGKSFLPSHNSLDPQTTSDFNKVSSISSPIILKSPNIPSVNGTGRNYAPPFSFFSVEELALVKCLSHWAKTKVCPIGRAEFDTISQQCYLHSVLEKGSWKVLLDTSLLEEIPKLKTVLQTFGCMEVIKEQPVLKVHFYRNLGYTDLNLFVNSYRMMQKHIPDFYNVDKSNILDEHRSPQKVSDGIGCELNDTLTTSDFNKVSSISSPIIFKSPNMPSVNGTGRNYAPPFSFFSVEELALVKCLSHWANTNVCPIGRAEFDTISQQCYLHSVLEKGSWKVLLDTSLLEEIPKLKTVLQTFGCMEVIKEQPVLKVHFYRNLGYTDLNLFVNSYRMMQKHIPDFYNVDKSNILDEHRSPQKVSDGIGCELNDTLDGFNFSIIEKCIDSANVINNSNNV